MLQLQTSGLIDGFRHGLAPVKKLSVSEWADTYRYLSTVSSAEPGLWRTSRTPYLKKIMDCLSSSSPIEKVIVMKGAQVGLTEAALNLVGYSMHIDPCAIMYVLPTADTGKRFSKTRVDPMIMASVELSKRIKSNRERDGGNTLLQKDFPGGTFILVTAEAPSGLRSTPAKIVILDEVDEYPLDLAGQGSPVDLAGARQRTFSKKKMFLLSTPLQHGTSVIENEFLDTDQNYYFVPCIHCNTLQILKFANLVWTKKHYSDVVYACEHCGCTIEERFKTRLLHDGDWMPTVGANISTTKIGFHLSSMYSPYGWHSWRTIAEEYDKSEGDEPKRKTFINTTLGETTKETGDVLEWEHIYNRRDTYGVNTIPEGVCFLTAGVDIQKDRIELEIVGWCKKKVSYSIDYRVLIGNTNDIKVWDKLAEVLNETWKGENGASMPILKMAVDTGYNTSEAYAFCRRFDGIRVIPVKGKDNLALLVSSPRAVDTNRRGKAVVGSIKVWNVGVSVIKSEVYGWLKLQIGEDGEVPVGYCHFPQYEQQYFKGLTGERLEFKIVKGVRKYEWVKKYERNEPLDCRVYARAAANVEGLDRFSDEHFDELLSNYIDGTKEEKPKKKPGSGFWK